MGGWPDGVDPIKHSTTRNNDRRVNNDDSDGDREKDNKDGVTNLTSKLIAKLKKIETKLTNEEKVVGSLATLERL